MVTHLIGVPRHRIVAIDRTSNCLFLIELHCHIWGAALSTNYAQVATPDIVFYTAKVRGIIPLLDAKLMPWAPVLSICSAGLISIGLMRWGAV